MARAGGERHAGGSAAGNTDGRAGGGAFDDRRVLWDGTNTTKRGAVAGGAAETGVTPPNRSGPQPKP